MGLYQGSFRPLGDAFAADVVILDALGNPLTGFDGSRPANATITTVNATNASGVLLAANAARREVYIEHEGSGTVYIAFAATATTAAYTLRLQGNSGTRLTLNGYTGVISVIRASGSSNLRVTEVTT